MQKNTYSRGIGIFFLGISIDQITKALARIFLEQSVTIMPFLLSLQYVENRGAAFGILQGMQWLFIVMSVVVLSAIVYYRKKILQERLLCVGAALIAAGTVGNLIDRLFLGWVIDFIRLPYWPLFNAADMMLTFGACIIIYWSLTEKKSRNI